MPTLPTDTNDSPNYTPAQHATHHNTLHGLNNELGNFTQDATAPATPVDGDLWIDVDDDSGAQIGISTLTANRQTGSYTLALTDGGLVVEMNVASGNNLTVPPNSSVPFPIGTVIELYQYGAGQTTVVPGSGVTIRSPGGKLKIAAQYGGASLRKLAIDEWTLEGNITT